jgi:hypothetical protein
MAGNLFMNPFRLEKIVKRGSDVFVLHLPISPLRRSATANSASGVFQVFLIKPWSNTMAHS